MCVFSILNSSRGKAFICSVKTWHSHCQNTVFFLTTRVRSSIRRGEGTFVACQYGPGGNFENGYPKQVNGPVKNIGQCEGKETLLGTKTKKELLPKRVKKCLKKAKKTCGKTELECLAKEMVKCKPKGVKFHEPELSHDPNSADYCPCCMDYYQMKSGLLDEEDEIELESVDEEATKKFEEAQNCCGGMDGHQKLGFMTPGVGSTRFFKR